MRVIGMMLGIPEEGHRAVREKTIGNLRTKGDGQMKVDTAAVFDGALYADYIDWRRDHPSDDLMTELLTIEFEDEKGVRRTLTREEVLTYITVIAGAGNETTGQLIGWIAGLMARYPHFWREIVEDRSLIDNAIEEILRFEPTGHSIARYVANDVEIAGTTIPAGSTALCLIAAANRDENKYPDGDVFDIHRKITQQRTFGVGLHFCLGAALARLEARLVIDELATRFPNGWDVDWNAAALVKTTTVRGWEKMPLVLK